MLPTVQQTPIANKTVSSLRFKGPCCHSMAPLPATDMTKPEKKVMLSGPSDCVMTRDHTMLVAKHPTQIAHAAYPIQSPWLPEPKGSTAITTPEKPVRIAAALPKSIRSRRKHVASMAMTMGDAKTRI